MISGRNKDTVSIWRMYVEEFLSTQRSKETIRAYQRELMKFVDLLFIKTTRDTERNDICDVEKCLSQATITFLTAIKKTDPSSGHVVNARTLNRRLATITSFLKYLYEHKHINEMPRLMKPFPVQKKSTTPSPTTEECIELLHYLDQYRRKGTKQFRNTMLLLFMFLLALRKSEALHLRWSDIDTNKKTLTLIQKGGTLKKLPLPPVLFRLLISYREHISPMMCSSKKSSRNSKNTTRTNGSVDDENWADWRETGSLFPCFRAGVKKPISSSSGYFIICALVKKVFPTRKLTPHSFRKAFIEQSLERKTDLVSIANATGHASIEMIKYYDTRDVLENNAVHDLVNLLTWDETQ